jgi:hypothetical protein
MREASRARLGDNRLISLRYSDPSLARETALAIARSTLPEEPTLLNADESFETAHEDAIAEAVSRLDELGDAVVGTLTREELESLVRTPPQPVVAVATSPCTRSSAHCRGRSPFEMVSDVLRRTWTLNEDVA